MAQAWRLVIDWVMRAEGISFTARGGTAEAAIWSWLPLPARGPPPKQCTVPKLPPLFAPTVDDQQRSRSW